MISALVALRVSDGLIDQVASEINKDSQVTHNFLRVHDRYNIWYVTKAGSREELEGKVMRIVNGFGLRLEDYVILYAERTYKIDVKFDLYEGESLGLRYVDYPVSRIGLRSPGYPWASTSP